MNATTTKRKVGRPPTGRNPRLMATIPRPLLTAIKVQAFDNEATFNETVRTILQNGLRTNGQRT